MTNKQLNREMKDWAQLRTDWINKLIKYPDCDDACLHIIRINAKIEMLRFQWNWHDESEKMDLVR